MSEQNALRTKAEGLKAQGNDAYKKEEFLRAADLYQQASKLQPDQPVYLSNLSAAQFESGGYEDALSSVNMALGMTEDLTVHRALRLKLLLRQAKIYAQISKFQEAIQSVKEILSLDNTHQQATALLSSLSNRPPSSTQVEQNILQRLVGLPRYRPAPRDWLEYYVVGHDIANSLLAAQWNEEEESYPWKDKFRIRIPKSDSRPFEFSALFCGIGDARNMYATLADIGLQMDTRKSTKSVRIHLTAVDIHPAAIARDLIVLFTLQELSTIPTQKHTTDSRARELLVMLHYLYWATVMPPCAHKTMMATIKRIHDALTTCTKDSVTKPLDLPWLYLHATAVEDLREQLKWWLTDGATCTSVNEMLPRDGPDPTDAHVFLPEEVTNRREAQLEQTRQNLIAAVDKPEMQDEYARRARKEGISLTRFKARLRKELESAPLSEFSDEMLDWGDYFAEQDHFQRYKILCPPEFADKDVPELGYIFRCMRLKASEGAEKCTEVMASCQEHEVVRPDDVEEVLEDFWKINCTFLTKYIIENDSSRSMLWFDPYKGQYSMTRSPELQSLVLKDEGILYDQSSKFFSAVAHGMRTTNGVLRIEIFVGDGFRVMDQIRYGALERSPQFPGKYDRIHLSNVSDYVGGHLHMFTVASPLLKEKSTAYLTTCCRMNTLAWEGIRNEVDPDYNKVADSYAYTYTGAIVSEIPSLFGVRLESPPGWPGDYTTWIKADAVKQISRSRLEQVLLRVFWKTIAPARYADYANPIHARECLNIHAWFRLLAHLKDLGYPPHVTQEFLGAMLENRMSANIQPHEEVPIPLATRLSSKPKVPISTAPFQTELQTATALWLPRLGLNICSPCVPAVEDLVRYSVRLVRPDRFDSLHIIRQHMTQLLCFGLPRDLNKTVPDVRNNLVGSFNAKTSLQIVTSFEWSEEPAIATFLLPRAKATEFTQKGYEVAIFDHMFWRITSRVAPCSAMVEVGTADTWDRTIRIPDHKTRTLSEEDGMLGDVLGLDRSRPTHKVDFPPTRGARRTGPAIPGLSPTLRGRP